MHICGIWGEELTQPQWVNSPWTKMASTWQMVLINIGSGNGLLPVWHQAVISTSADLLLAGPTGRNLAMSYTLEMIIPSKGRLYSMHYSDIIMSYTASQITGISIVCSAIFSGADQRKHQISTSLAFVWGIHRWLNNSPHKGPITWKMFPFDNVIMEMQ